MRIKINLLAKINMGSMSTPRPNQRHQQVARAYRRSTISFFSGQQALCRLTAGNFVLNALSSVTLLHELWHALAQAMRALAKGHNGFLWSCKVKLCIWRALNGRFQFLPELARAHRSWRQSHNAPSKSHNCPSIRLKK